MASWGSYVFELCRIGAYQGLTAEIDWNYTSWSRRCRKILIGLVVRGAKTVVVRGKNRILTRNRKKPEMTVPISHRESFRQPQFFELMNLCSDMSPLFPITHPDPSSYPIVYVLYGPIQLGDSEVVHPAPEVFTQFLESIGHGHSP